MSQPYPLFDVISKFAVAKLVRLLVSFEHYAIPSQGVCACNFQSYCQFKVQKVFIGNKGPLHGFAHTGHHTLNSGTDTVPPSVVTTFQEFTLNTTYINGTSKERSQNHMTARSRLHNLKVTKCVSYHKHKNKVLQRI